MNVNEAIKNIKKELKTICQENKKYNNEIVNNHIIDVKNELKQIEKERNYMLDISMTGYDYRESMKTSVNWCFSWLSECNYHFRLECYIIEDITEYEHAKKYYNDEENRLNSIKI